jgi:hypothetical protein
MGQEIERQLVVPTLERHLQRRGAEEGVRGVDVRSALDEPLRHREMALFSRVVEGCLAITGRRVHRGTGGEQCIDPRQIPGARRLAQRLARIVGTCRQGGDEENEATEEKNGTAAA